MSPPQFGLRFTDIFLDNERTRAFGPKVLFDANTLERDG